MLHLRAFHVFSLSYNAIYISPKDHNDQQRTKHLIKRLDKDIMK